MSSTPTQSTPTQSTIDDLGTPLADTTFVVVDLETTGGSAKDGAEITEIGAVRVRGGSVEGEFASLVRPTTSIPAFISVLTGITDTMVAAAPTIASVLPSFLEFARGGVLVAHNAAFDLGFLRQSARHLELSWPPFVVLDTVRIARRALTRDEAPNCKLATLATVFRTGTTPTHRALDDARATVDVLHGLIERLGNQGVRTLEELTAWQTAVSPAQRRKRHLADALPSGPGVYIFVDGQGEALYIGKSRDIRSRVRTYFTASESRRRMAEMVSLAESVVPVACATELESEVRELRLIGERKPRYNRRSRFPEHGVWIKLTDEPFPRFSLVRTIRSDHATYVGPFGSRRAAQQAVDALQEALPIRRCTTRLSPGNTHPACVLAELGRCGAPCTGAQSVESYARVTDTAREALTGDPDVVVEHVHARLRELARGERFEEAAHARDRLVTLLRGLVRGQRVAALAAVPELCAARPGAEGGWELHVVRWGRLAAAAQAPRGVDPRPVLTAARATAETVASPTPPASAAVTEETESILRWLDSPGVRLVEIQGTWAEPARGAARFRSLITAADAGSRVTAR